MAKENDAPTEIETITLTMSRPICESDRHPTAETT